MISKAKRAIFDLIPASLVGDSIISATECDLYFDVAREIFPSSDDFPVIDWVAHLEDFDN